MQEPGGVLLQPFKLAPDTDFGITVAVALADKLLNLGRSPKFVSGGISGRCLSRRVTNTRIRRSRPLGDAVGNRGLRLVFFFTGQWHDLRLGCCGFPALVLRCWRLVPDLSFLISAPVGGFVLRVRCGRLVTMPGFLPLGIGRGNARCRGADRRAGWMQEGGIGCPQLGKIMC